MGIKFKAEHVCEKCKKTFEWNDFELKRQNISSEHFDPETLPSGLVLAHMVEHKERGIYLIGVNCPFCSYDNVFLYDKNK